jgi:putative selenate reductase molybdopterin-binding subunit
VSGPLRVDVVEGRPGPALHLEKVTGAGRFPGDYRFAGCRYAAVVRSDRAAAEVRASTAAAAGMPGVYAAVSRTDLGLGSRVRQVGDVVAAVVADSQAAADAAAAAVAAEYTTIPGVYDAHPAADSAVLVDPDMTSNVVREDRREHGDVEAALRRSAVRYSAVYRTGRAVHFNLSPRCCFATVDPGSGVVELVTSADAPFFARKELAQALGLPEDRVQITVAELPTSSFGSRTSINELFEPVAARLALLCPGVPVRLLFTPAEEIAVSYSRHPVELAIEAGAAADGRLLGLRIEMIADHGAHPSFVSNIVLSNCRDRALDLVKVDNYRFTGRVVLTNNTTAGEMRGIGVAQVMWALGSHLDELAARLGMDPVDFLTRNLAPAAASQEAVVGSAKESLTRCLAAGRERLLEVADDHQPGGSCRHGWGVATGLHTTGLGTFHGGDRSTVRMRLDPDGTVWLGLAAPDSGQGGYTAYTKLAATALGIPPERVSVEPISTRESPYDQWGSVASRGAYIVGAAVLDAAGRLREAAAGLGGSMRPSTPIVVTGTSHSTANPPTYGACFVRVCVDLDTGAVRTLHAVSAFDVGRAIDPQQCAGQLVGAFGMGWEFALGDELRLESGVPVNADPYEFRLVHAEDLPCVDTILVERPEASSAHGARGVGTPAITPVAAAICNAIRNATGVRPTRLPVTAERLLRGLDQLAGSGGPDA